MHPSDETKKSKSAPASSASPTDARHHHADLTHAIAFRKTDRRNGDLIHALCGATGITDKMDMVVMVMALLTGLFAQGIPNDIVGAGDYMDDPFL